MYQPYQIVSSGMQIHHPGEAPGGAWMAYQDREGRPCWHNTATNQWTYNLSSSVGDGSTFYSTPSFVGGFPQVETSPAGIYTYWSQPSISTPTAVVGSPATVMGGWSSVTPTGAVTTSPVSQPFAMVGYSGGSGFVAPTGTMVPAPAPMVTYMSSGTPITFMPQQQQQGMPTPFSFQSGSGVIAASTPTPSTPVTTTTAAAAVGAVAGTAAAGMFGGPPLMTTPQPHPMYIDPNGPHAAMLIGAKGASSMPPFGPPAMGHFGPMPTDPSAFIPDWMRWPGMPGVFPGVIGGSAPPTPKEAEAAPVSADEDGEGDGDDDGDDGEDGDGGEEKAEEPKEEAKDEAKEEEAKEEVKEDEEKKEDEAKEEGGGDSGGDGGEEAPAPAPEPEPAPAPEPEPAPAPEPEPAEEPAPKEEPAPETPPPEVPPPKGTGSEGDAAAAEAAAA